MKNTFIIGCGDIGQRVARIFQIQGTAVYGLARSQESANRLKALNIYPIRGDLSQPGSLSGVFSDNAESISGAERFMGIVRVNGLPKNNRPILKQIEDYDDWMPKTNYDNGR